MCGFASDGGAYFDSLMKHQRELRPFPYHGEVTRLLRERHPAVWHNYVTRQAMSNQHADVELHLLKSTYRMPEGEHPELYEAVERGREILSIEQPVVLFHGSTDDTANAFMYYTPAKGYLVFQGDLLERFSAAEIVAVIGHELGHYKLWCEANGDYLTADRILKDACGDAEVADSVLESRRRYSLYTEVYCDRAGFLVAGELAPAVTGEVKLLTGLADADAESYLRQVDEIFEQSEAHSAGKTHPEAFIRARAVGAFARLPTVEEADALVAEMLEPGLSLDALDLTGQERLAGATRRLVEDLLGRSGRAPEAWIEHAARLRVEPVQPCDRAGFEGLLARAGSGVRDYFAYVLLDFAALILEGRERPVQAVMSCADEWGLGERLQEIAYEELNWDIAKGGLSA